MTRRRRSVALATILAATLLLPAATSAAGTAVDDAYSVAEDVTLDVSAAEGVLANDLPAEANLSVQRGDGPEHGSLALNLNSGLFRYTPDPNFHGTDTFTYRNLDETTDPSNEATVTITVTPVDDAAIAVDDAGVLVDAGVPGWLVNVLANDGDPDGGVVSVASATDGAKGTTWVPEDGSAVIYVPDAGATGDDAFTYTLVGGSSASVSLTIVQPLHVPFAATDQLTVAEDASTTIDPRVNDSDPQGDPLEVVGVDVTAAGNGTVTFTSTSATYTPHPDVSGIDSFVYYIDDGSDYPIRGLVEVTITAVNDAPVASPDSLVALEDGPAVSIDPRTDDTDADGDPLTVVAVSATTHGKGTVGFTATSVSYTPNANATGGDGFTYTVSDGRGGTDEALVAVSITPVNDPPNAADDSLSVPAGAGATAVAVLANDTTVPDVGETLAISAVTQPPNGAVVITGGGSGLTYAPKALFRGTDSFTYTVSDGNGGTDSATVAVGVLDHAPPTVALPSTAIRTGVGLGTSSVSARVTWSAGDVGSGIRSYQLQQSANGGAFTTIPLSSATATSAVRSLAVGTGYVFRVRATDGAGNVSAWRTAAAIRPALYQEATSLATYSGTWATSLQSSASGGKTRYATRTTSSVTFRFNGRDVALVAPRFTSSGRVRIYLDGVLVSTVDLDTTTGAARQVVFQRHFTAVGPHTLKLQVYGDGRVDADAFVVLR